MIQGKTLAFWGLLVCTGTVLISTNGCAGSSGRIQHVVIVFQENRTPDNLFHDQKLIDAGADIASSGVNSKRETIPLSPIDLGTSGSDPQNYDLVHSHGAFISMYDKGKMDGANLTPCSPRASCPPDAQFMYVKPSDVAPYFAMAEQYTFGDRMFQTNQGPSMPAHQYIIAGTSWDGIAGSNLFQAELPSLSRVDGGGVEASDNTGCSAPTNETARMINISNPSFPANETTLRYPCWNHRTLIDLLDARSISWKYYADVKTCTPPNPCPPTGIWVGPNAIQHLCGNSGPGTPCAGPEWTNHVVVQTRILTDIANGQLPAVSWVIPDGKYSDHASLNDGEGPSWVSSIVNGIGNSSYWTNTAIIVTWDDWGGWYDHVAPSIRSDNSYEYGFRVPLIIISPYAKAHHISHVKHDFGSILKFIENVYNLPTIDPRVRFADARADDLSDCFNFSQTPLTFSTIPAPYSASHFLNDKRPPVDPDDD